MPNTMVNSVLISKELLMQFENVLELGSSVDWSYNDKFGETDAQIGASYRVRRPVLYTVGVNNMSYTANAQATQDLYSQITVSTSFTTALNFSDADLTLNIERFSDRYVKQAATVFAAKLDALIADSLTNAQFGASVVAAGSTPTGTPTANGAGWVVGTFGTALTTDTVLYAKQLLLDSACPDDGDIVGILTPLANRQLSNNQITLFNAQKEISRIYTKGYIGEFAGITWKVSQSLVSHTNGGQATLAAGTYTEPTVWAETFTLPVTATTAAVNMGDVFTAAGVYWVNPLTKAVTGNLAQFTVVGYTGAGAGYVAAPTGSTSLVISPAPVLTGAYQNVSATLQSKSLALVGATAAVGQESLIFHKKAVAAVSPELVAPKKSSFDMVEVIGEDEYRFRFLRGYDMVGASGAVQFVSRLDAFFGVKVLRAEWAIRVRS